MRELVPDDLRRCSNLVAETLSVHLTSDFSIPAGELEWSCQRTLEHLVGALLWYSGNLARLSHEPCSRLSSGLDTPPTQLVDALVSSGYILALVAEGTPPGGRAYHPLGMADTTGFLAMGCDEILIHSYDIYSGLGVEFEIVDDDIVNSIVDRLFPWAPQGHDPWETLLWCNGRIALPERARLAAGWRWWCRPLGEFDGVVQLAVVEET